MRFSNFLNDIFNLHALRFTHLFRFIWLCWVLVVTWYVGSLIFLAAGKIINYIMWTLSCSMWNLVPRLGIEPRPPALGKEALATGAPGKSHGSLFVLSNSMGFDQCLCRASTISGSHPQSPRSHASPIQPSTLSVSPYQPLIWIARYSYVNFLRNCYTALQSDCTILLYHQ